MAKTEAEPRDDERERERGQDGEGRDGEGSQPGLQQVQGQSADGTGTW